MKNKDLVNFHISMEFLKIVWVFLSFFVKGMQSRDSLAEWQQDKQQGKESFEKEY